MFRRIRTGCSLSALLLLSMHANSAESKFAQCMVDVRYEIVELTTEQERNSHAADLNDRGQVTGEGDFRVDDVFAFEWNCGSGLRALDEPGRPVAFMGHVINNRGQIAGYSTRDYVDTRPFFWSPGTGFRDIESLFSSAYDINDWGDVAVRSVSGSVSHLWDHRRGLRTFREATGVDFEGEPALNNLRTIGGVATTSQGRQFVVWNPMTGLRLMAPISQGVEAKVTAMNDRDDMIGRLGADYFLLTSNGELQVIDVGGRIPSDINNWRQIVITSSGTPSSPSSTNFVWDPVHGSREFNDLVVDEASPQRYYSLDAINNWGWIAGAVRGPDSEFPTGRATRTRRNQRL